MLQVRERPPMSHLGLRFVPFLSPVVLARGFIARLPCVFNQYFFQGTNKASRQIETRVRFCYQEAARRLLIGLHDEQSG
jgi:hypothetical protein